jgi:hypothetical protein
MNRREFLQWSGGVWATALATRPLALLAATQSTMPVALNSAQWQSVAAICEQIIPTVDGCGAGTANCVNFIDKLLAHEERTALPFYRQGLLEIDRHAARQWQKKFAALNAEQQVKCLEDLEDGLIADWPAAIDQKAFFTTLRFHTILGFLAAPKFGGNADFAGWRAMSFPGHIHEMGGLSDRQVSGEEPIHPSWEH